jgi:hypothetical protein
VSIIAIALAVAGTLLISVSIYGLRTPPKPNEPAETNHYQCEAPSPDDALRCDQEIGHWGWHRNGETSWFGESWDCDHWSDTQASPIPAEPTMLAAVFRQSSKGEKHRRYKIRATGISHQDHTERPQKHRRYKIRATGISHQDHTERPNKKTRKAA